MKKKALVAAVLAATTFSATTAFAASNPFNDVPADHWSYDAIEMLARDGVIEGYGDGTFQGDKLMNRYEMAEIVAKAAEKYGTADLKDKGVINKLEREYAQELKDMEVRLTAVESDVKDLKAKQSSFKMYGDARLRYFANKDMSGHDNSGSSGVHHFEKRVRLGIYGEPAKNLTVDGRLKYDDKSGKHNGWGSENRNLNNWNNSYNNQDSFHLDKMSLNWHNAGTTTSVGRTQISLGQGLLYWENPVDGFYVEHQFGPKTNLMLGYGDISAEGWQNSNIWTAFGNLKVQTSKATQLTAAFLHTNTDNTGNTTVNVYDEPVVDDYHFNQYALGFNTQFAPRWNLIAEYVRNNAGCMRDKSGFWTRVTYGSPEGYWVKNGTFQIYGEYFALGGGSIESVAWPHRLNIAGSDGINGNGSRGFGIGMGRMLADNVNLEATCYWLKPYDKNHAGFSKYDPTGYVALSYCF
ncbi:S-layer homology domain-containing protein [uncultured Selenomonas sp.]|uniref:S-layer homology domain-containing protein n=1 Tax=uncultured Selenomonas sp. TaxID=159275 RepID=UPI0025FD095E|nr:S-layer homology domain-containing protein [uncultured Selenomonas sp.]